MQMPNPENSRCGCCGGSGVLRTGCESFRTCMDCLGQGRQPVADLTRRSALAPRPGPLTTAAEATLAIPVAVLRQPPAGAIEHLARPPRQRCDDSGSGPGQHMAVQPGCHAPEAGTAICPSSWTARQRRQHFAADDAATASTRDYPDNRQSTSARHTSFLPRPRSECRDGT